MPHVSDGGGVDLSSNDEIKVFHVEGEGRENEERSSSENLKELKSSLVAVAEVPGEEEKNERIPSQSFIPSKNSHFSRSDFTSLIGKQILSPSPYGLVVSPFHPHPNGALGSFPMHVSDYVPSVSIVTEDREFYRRWPFQVNRVPMVPPHHVSSFPLMMYPPHEGVQPPPAHMGIPPLHIDPKTGDMKVPDSIAERWRKDLSGFARPTVTYPFPTTAAEYFCTNISQPLQWPPSSMYHTFRPPAYPGSVSLPPSMPTKFSPPLLPHHSLSSSISHHPLLVSGAKTELSESQDNLHLQSMNQFSHHQRNNHSATSNSSNSSTHHLHSHHQNSSENARNGRENSPSSVQSEKKKSHIKKPLNAFMLFMKEMRPSVQAECTLKESAAINQILGRRWHNLTRDQQAKYYEMAKEARQLHQQRYPGWTARDNYAINAKKKKKKRDKSQDGDGNNPKKCRARFGLDQQSSWCKPCRRKKKCIRYLSGDNAGEGEENIGSVESITSEAATPDSRFDASTSLLSEDDSGNAESNSSEFSISSPSVPRPLDSVQSVLENSKQFVGSPPSQQIHHPLNVQHLSRSSGLPRLDSPERNLPRLPTPPSTDSSSTTAVAVAIT